MGLLGRYKVTNYFIIYNAKFINICIRSNKMVTSDANSGVLSDISTFFHSTRSNVFFFNEMHRFSHIRRAKSGGIKKSNCRMKFMQQLQMSDSDCQILHCGVNPLRCSQR